MSGSSSRVPAAVALVGAVLGVTFSGYSTLDYAEHLDRRVHDLHCSFVPGAEPTAEAEACRTAMYSPFSALFKEELWGGVPISLFGLGAFAFLFAFALYLLLAGSRAPRAAVTFFGLVGVTPLLVSVAMFTISITRLGGLCKTCVGIYIASLVVAVGALWSVTAQRGPAESRRAGVSWLLPVAWLFVMGIVTLLPAWVYAQGVPDHRPFLTNCGHLAKPKEPHDALVKIRGARAVQPSIFFEDPLCPTCKAFHERLTAEGALDRLDIQLALFPLDSECNWMLDRPLHPGACTVSKVILCSENPMTALEWAFEQQEELTRAGAAGEPALRELLSRRFGAAMLKCVDSRETKLRLNRHLHFAADNSIPVSTPQVYLGDLRLCDEDTDIGLRYALKQLAPEVLR
jgi:uncharacterized membrane protein